MLKPLAFDYEQAYWQQGIEYLAGIDEVGMGALAGPVVAAAVVFDPKTPLAPLVRGDEAKINQEIKYMPYNKRLTELAREYRTKPTLAEEMMWRKVLRKGVLRQEKFTRQKPLDQFIADFYCAELMLVVEVDGDIHEYEREHDQVRTELLSDYGIEVIRYTNNQLMQNPALVYNDLVEKLAERRSAVVPPDKGGKGGFAVVQDSKKLTPKKRDQAAVWIKEHAHAWAIGEASVDEITKLNIRGASHLAMRRAVDALAQAPELLLIDGTPAQPHPAIPALSIIDGDALVFSIAAASIIAKVHRDAIMAALDAEYPHYGWGSNKGYGSRLHLVALGSHGVTPHHRSTYAPIAQRLTK